MSQRRLEVLRLAYRIATEELTAAQKRFAKSRSKRASALLDKALKAHRAAVERLNQATR